MRPLEFIVIRGPARVGKSTVARSLAGRLGGSAAVIPVDELLERWIAIHDRDGLAEVAMVYRQVRLLSSGYLRNRYHVVVEGRFVSVDGSETLDHAPELYALRSLMRTIPGVRTTQVLLTAAADELRRRPAPGDPSFEAALEHYASARAGDSLVFDTAGLEAAVVADRILVELGLFGG